MNRTNNGDELQAKTQYRAVYGTRKSGQGGRGREEEETGLKACIPNQCVIKHADNSRAQKDTTQGGTQMIGIYLIILKSIQETTLNYGPEPGYFCKL